MPFHYLAISLPPDDLDDRNVSIRTVADEVLRRWPQAQISYPEDGIYSFVWLARGPGSATDGGLFRDGSAIAMDGSVEASASIAAWFRTVMGSIVTFTDEGNHGAVEIEEGMTIEHIVEARVADALGPTLFFDRHRALGFEHAPAVRAALQRLRLR